MTDDQRTPDPLKDIYWMSVRKAYEAAKDPEVPIELVPEYVDAAAFFGTRLDKSEDDVMADCINYSIFIESGGTEHE